MERLKSLTARLTNGEWKQESRHLSAHVEQETHTCGMCVSICWTKVVDYFIGFSTSFTCCFEHCFRKQRVFLCFLFPLSILSPMKNTLLKLEWVVWVLVFVSVCVCVSCVGGRCGASACRWKPFYDIDVDAETKDFGFAVSRWRETIGKRRRWMDYGLEFVDTRQWQKFRWRKLKTTFKCFGRGMANGSRMKRAWKWMGRDEAHERIQTNANDARRHKNKRFGNRHECGGRMHHTRIAIHRSIYVFHPISSFFILELRFFARARARTPKLKWKINWTYNGAPSSCRTKRRNVSKWEKVFAHQYSVWVVAVTAPLRVVGVRA